MSVSQLQEIKQNKFNAYLLKNNGLSNYEIEIFLKKHCTNNFKGVYSADEIPTELSSFPTFSIVCNLDKKIQVGSHFVVILGFPTYIFYIDPLGNKCTTPAIRVFLNKNAKERDIYYNTVQIQDLFSLYCGVFCIMYILYYDKDRMQELDMLKYNLNLNNGIAISNINKMIN